MNDSMTRTTTAIVAVNAVSIPFDTPSRALLVGEWVTDQTYYYPVTSCTTAAIGIGTAEGQSTAGIRAQLADNTALTRFDYYAPTDFENVLDAVGKGDVTDSEKAEIFKAALYARLMIEEKIGYIKARSKSQTFSLDSPSTRLYLPELRIESVTSVTISDTLIDSDDYTLDQEHGYIYYDNGCFPAGLEHIDVVYSPGWATPTKLIHYYLMQTRLNWALAASGQDMLVYAEKPAYGGGASRATRNPEDIQKEIDRGLMAFAKVSM